MTAATPVYVDIAAELRARITGGELAPGDRLLSEAALVAKHGASRGTIRAALQRLRGEGLIVAGQGRGWYVRDPRRVVWVASAPETNTRTDVQPSDTWAADIRSQGRVPGQDLRVEMVKGPAWVARLLDIGDGAMIVRRRWRFVDGMLANTADTYYPEALVRGTPIAQPDDVLPGTYAVMESIGCGWVHPPEDEILPRPASARECEMFGIDTGVAVAEVRRIRRMASGRVVAVTLTVMPGDRNVIRYNPYEEDS